MRYYYTYTHGHYLSIGELELIYGRRIEIEMIRSDCEPINTRARVIKSKNKAHANFAIFLPALSLTFTTTDRVHPD